MGERPEEERGGRRSRPEPRFRHYRTAVAHGIFGGMEVDRNGMVVLGPADCFLRLGRAGIGRVAVSVGALPAIFPVNYAVDGPDIYFRTAAGTKLAAASRDAVVAFEVDESDRMSHTGWSVQVVGPAMQVTDPQELSRLKHLPLEPWLGSEGRTLVRIRGELVTGRALTHVRRTNEDRARTDGWLMAACPACGSDALRGVSDGDMANILCETCMACWHNEPGGVYRVYPPSCPGCALVDVCHAAHAHRLLAV